jgi:hypothetical protein
MAKRVAVLMKLKDGLTVREAHELCELLRRLGRSTRATRTPFSGTAVFAGRRLKTGRSPTRRSCTGTTTNTVIRCFTSHSGSLLVAGCSGDYVSCGGNGDG